MGLGIVAIPSTSGVSQLTISVILLMIFTGILATAGQLLLTEGYNYVSVGTGSVFAMLVPVLNFISGLLFFNEKLTAIAALGATITIVSCCSLICPEKWFSAIWVPKFILKPL